MVAASEKDPEGWSASDKFTVVLESAGLNATELGVFCRERGLYPVQGGSGAAVGGKKDPGFLGRERGSNRSGRSQQREPPQRDSAPQRQGTPTDPADLQRAGVCGTACGPDRAGPG